MEEKLPVMTVLILFRHHTKATNHYHDAEVDYRYKLIKLYEMYAREVLDTGARCLYPFIPLMKDGEGLIDEAERRIYESDESREYKADLLTGMAILGGIVSEEIPVRLMQRRRDIMIESAAYEIIKQEGLKEGIQKGIQEGIQQGIQQGIQNAQEMVIEVMEERFGIPDAKLIGQIKSISMRELLRALHKYAIRARDMDDFKEQLKKVVE